MAGVRRIVDDGGMDATRMRASVIGAIVLTLAGCASTGIAIKEKLGYAKREQLVDAVEAARDDQTEAKQQFQSALAEFLAVTRVDAGELESRYEALRTELGRCEGRADDVHDRVRSVERVAKALFAEWEDELDQYASASLRQASAAQLRETRARYDRLLNAMHAAEQRMEPVLVAFRDQVLFLKHNLNARAIAALGSTVSEVESDVQRLVAEMESSIDAANAFIASMAEEG